MKLVAATVALAGALLATAPPAAASPPVGAGGHVHHIITGNGICVPIDSVSFLREARGLHQGATASGTSGPDHGACP